MAQVIAKQLVHLKRFQKNSQGHPIAAGNQSIVLTDCLRVSQKAIVHQYPNGQSQKEVSDGCDGSQTGIKLASTGTPTDHQSWRVLPQKRAIKSTTVNRVLNINTPKRYLAKGNHNITRYPSNSKDRGENGLTFESIGGAKTSVSRAPVLPTSTRAPIPPTSTRAPIPPTSIRAPIPPTSTRAQSTAATTSPRPSQRFRRQQDLPSNAAHDTRPAPTRKNSFTICGSEIKCNVEKHERDETSRLLRKREALKERPPKLSHSQVSSRLKQEKPVNAEKACGHPPSSVSYNSTLFMRRNRSRMVPSKWKPASPSDAEVNVIDGEGQGRSKTSTGHYPKGDIDTFVRCTKSARSFRRPAPESSNSHVLLEADCRNMSRRLEEALYSDNLPKFRESLSSFVRDDRKKIVDFKETCGSPNVFFRACTLSKVPFVEFMIVECRPNLELTGPFIIQDEDSEHMVTPLWHAAATGNLNLLRLLKEAGGNIDTCSDTGSTAVLAACYMSHMHAVKYLVSNKVNVHLVNVRGLTCLMSAVHNVDLVRLLVLNGAEINRADLRGNSAMHYAAKDGHLTVIRILHELGGNPLQANNEGFSVIQIAAKHRRREIMELLLQTSSTLKVGDVIDVYELFGSMAILLDNDLESGYSHFYKAMTLRYVNKSNFIWKCRKTPSELGKSENTREFNTIPDLLQAVDNPDDLTIQALLVYERQRGCMRDDFLHLLIYCGATFADKRNFQRAANLWNLSYRLNFRKYVGGVESCSEPFNQQLIKNVHSIVKLLCQWKREESTSLNDTSYAAAAADEDDDNVDVDLSYQSPIYYRIPECTIREIFLHLCDHISFAHQYLKNSSPAVRSRYQQSFFLLTRSILCVLYIYIDSYSVFQRQEEVWQRLKPLANVPFIGTSGQTLLHMSVLPDTIELLEVDSVGNLFTWPSVAVVDILLLLGADPKTRDETGSTPVHLATTAHRQGMPSAMAVMESLLAKRGHADQMNSLGQTAIDLLPSGKLKQRVLQYVSLKCRAAQVITKNNIPYLAEVPPALYSFIELHRNVLDE